MIKNYPNEDKLHATGVERSFIACLMKFPNLISSAESSIRIEDLYSPNFHVLYKTILRMKEHYDLKQQSYVFSQELICRWLETAEEEDRRIINSTVSKFSFLNMIQSAAGVDLESFGKYIDMIKHTSALIKAYRACVDLGDKIMNPSSILNAQEIVMEANSIFSKIAVDDQVSSIVKLGDCVSALQEDIRFNKQNKGRIGVWLPEFPRLMKVINGIRRSQFIIVFARPKTGKSSLLLNMALSTASQGIPVLYLDTEMTQKEQASRALSNWSGIREWDIMGGEFLDNEEKNKVLVEYANKLSNAPLYYVAAKGGDVNKICAYMKEFVEKYVGFETTPDGNKKTKECLVVYDWLKVADSDSLKRVKEYQELGFLATALNDTRRELDIPLIAGAQANRFGNEKEVGLDSAFNAQNFLADSDRLLRFCTCLIWLRRLNFDESNLMKEHMNEHPNDGYNQMIHVVDQRGGPICLEGIGLSFTGENLTYQEKEPVNLLKVKVGKKKRTKEEKMKELEDSNSVIVEETIVEGEHAQPF